MMMGRIFVWILFPQFCSLADAFDAHEGCDVKSGCLDNANSAFGVAMLQRIRKRTPEEEVAQKVSELPPAEQDQIKQQMAENGQRTLTAANIHTRKRTPEEEVAQKVSELPAAEQDQIKQQMAENGQSTLTAANIHTRKRTPEEEVAQKVSELPAAEQDQIK